MGIGIRTYRWQETTWIWEYSHCLQKTGCHLASTMKSQIQLICRLRSLGGNLKSAPPGGQGETQEGGRTLRVGRRQASQASQAGELHFRLVLGRRLSAHPPASWGSRGGLSGVSVPHAPQACSLETSSHCENGGQSSIPRAGA